MSAIKLSAVSKRFGRDLAVNQVSLNVNEGEFITLLGPSGCGKTTTLRMIAGFMTPSDGEIFFDDQSVTTLPPYKRDIGMVFQSLALFPHMTVAENVAYGLRLRHKRGSELEKAVRDMLALVRLADFKSRMPEELSGGQRQRVAVARALAINPGILLLDEPFAALDRKLREEMQVEIMRLHERLQVTTVFVTHDQREAFTLSDRIAVMNEGRIEQLDTPQAVYYRPESQFVADFVGLSNLFKVQIITHNGDTSIVELPEEGVQLEVPIDRGTTLNDSHFLFIRPEFIKLESEDRVDASCLTATVDLIRFVGELIETRLTTQGGAQVVATYQGREMPQLAAGQKVSIRLYTQNARLLQ